MKSKSSNAVTACLHSWCQCRNSHIDVSTYHRNIQELLNVLLCNANLRFVVFIICCWISITVMQLPLKQLCLYIRISQANCKRGVYQVLIIYSLSILPRILYLPSITAPAIVGADACHTPLHGRPAQHCCSRVCLIAGTEQWPIARALAEGACVVD